MFDNGLGMSDKDPFFRFIDGFTNSLHYQLDSFRAGSALHRSPAPLFEERVGSALQKAMKAVQHFKEEILSAASGEEGDWDFTSLPPPTSRFSHRTSMLQEADVNADVPTERAYGEASPTFCSLVQKQVESYVSDDIKRQDVQLQLNGDGLESIDTDTGKCIEAVSSLVSQHFQEAKSPCTSPKVQFALKDLWEDGRKVSGISQTSEPQSEAYKSDMKESRESQSSAGEQQPNCIDLDEAQEEEEKNSKCVQGSLNPNWHGRLAWDLNTMVLVLIDAMVLPLQMAYKEGQPPDGFDVFWLYATTSFFAVDIVLNFNTAYAAGKKDTEFEPGRLVTNRRLIARNYCRTWLPIDVVSTVPWGQLSSILMGGEGSGGAGQLGKLTKVIKFVRFMRLMRMLRLAKLAAIWERIEAKSGSIILLQGVGLLRVLFVLVCICHWNACIWWMIGQPRSLFTELLSEEAALHWEISPHWTTITRSLGPGMDEWTWLERSPNEAYIFCFYWTLGVMRTMPAEVQPVNQVERLYIMIFMFFAFSAFAICVAQITQTFFKFSERRRTFNDDMANVRLYLRGIKVSEQLQLKVKMYLRHLYDTRVIQAKETALLKNVTEDMREELRKAKLAMHFEKFEFMKNVRPSAFQIILSRVNAVIFEIAPGDILSNKGHIPQSAYVVTVGRLHVVRTHHPDESNKSDSEKTRVKTVDIVDEECLMDYNYKSRHTVAAMLASTVLTVSREEFWRLRHERPDLLEKDRRSRRNGRMSQNSVNSSDFAGMGRMSIISGATVSTSVRPSFKNNDNLGNPNAYGNTRKLTEEDDAITAAVIAS